MMSIEPRNEQLMLRQFRKTYPSYNLNLVMRKRYEELMDARAFDEWLQNRQLKQQGEEYADAMGRIGRSGRWAGAERRQVLPAANHAAAAGRQHGAPSRRGAAAATLVNKPHARWKNDAR